MTTKKEHINVGTIGHVDHGKTTLTAALTHVQAARVGGKAKTYDEIAKASEAQGRRDPSKVLTIATAHVEYESATRHFAHIDCPGHADYVKNMITGAAQMDAAILLVDASQSVQQQTREHILLARQVGIDHIVAFLNKCDIADHELVEIVQLETVEMLESQGYKDMPLVFGSARGALEEIFAGKTGQWTKAVQSLVDLLDKVPLPKRDVDAPFLMPIEDVKIFPGRGTVATGRVSRGTLKVGDVVELVGLVDENEKPREIVVTGTQAFHKDIDAARAGDNVGLLLRGVKHDEIERGQILAKPGSIKPHAKGTAEFYCLSTKEGGRTTPFTKGYTPQFFFGTTDVTGMVAGLKDAEIVTPGDRATIDFELQKPVGVEPGMRFAVREGGKTVGAGVVTAVL
jgi:elongation factor Tu